jgi:thiol-disulfide isomerase/thioredoxin
MSSPVAVYVFSKPGCKPCQHIKPFLNELREDYSQYTWVDVDVSADTLLSQKMSVNAVPCVVVTRNGAEKGRFIGTQNLPVLLSLLKNA